MSLWKTGSYSYPFLATQWNFHVEQNIGLIFRYYTKAFQNIEGIQQGNWTTECIHKGKRKVSFFLPANTAFHWNVGTKLTLCLAKTLNAIKKKIAARFWFPFSLNYFITHIYKLSTWKDSCVHTIEKHKNIKASSLNSVLSPFWSWLTNLFSSYFISVIYFFCWLCLLCKGKCL